MVGMLSHCLTADYRNNKKIADDIHQGPYTGTFLGAQRTGQQPQPPPIVAPPPTTNLSVTGAYAKAAGTFDSHHFAVWGRTASYDISKIQSVVNDYPADIMLLMLGFNDIAW